MCLHAVQTHNASSGLIHSSDFAAGPTVLLHEQIHACIDANMLASRTTKPKRACGLDRCYRFTEAEPPSGGS